MIYLAKRRTTSDLAEIFAFLYVLIMLTIFPLHYDDGFFNIVQAKLAFFAACTLTGLCALLALCILRRPSLGSIRNMCSRELVCLAAFLGANIVSALLSAYPDTALYGLPNRYNGLCVQILYFVVFVIACLVHSSNKLRALTHVYALVSSLIYALGILNYFGMDPLGLYAEMSSELYTLYVSTIGNINFYGTFICLSLPLFIYKAVYSVTRKESAIYMALSTLGSAALLLSNCDSAYMGILAALVFIVCQRRFTVCAAVRLAWQLAAMCAAFLFIGMIHSLPSSTFAHLRFASAMLCTPLVSGFACIGFAVFGTALRSYAHNKGAQDRKAYVSARILCISLAACVMSFLLYANIARPIFIMDSPAKNLVIFSDTWGSNRGYVWGRLVYLFGEAPLTQKLFGAGPDSVGQLLNPHYTVYIQALNGTTFDSAHNEYLQYLLSIGIIGLCAYFGFIFCVLRRGINAHSVAVRGFAACVVAYCVQAVFNIAMPITTPILFIMCGLCCAYKIKPRVKP